jgi:hypothetical protein
MIKIEQSLKFRVVRSLVLALVVLGVGVQVAQAGYPAFCRVAAHKYLDDRVSGVVLGGTAVDVCCKDLKGPAGAPSCNTNPSAYGPPVCRRGDLLKVIAGGHDMCEKP